MAGEWVTVPRERLTRAELAARYGGNPHAGRVMASETTPNVLLFSDPADDRRTGLGFDGWDRDREVFRFAGRGTVGDQTPAGNRALHDHLEQGRSLRLFVTEGTVPGSRTERHSYVGEFRIDPRSPYEPRRARDRDGTLRTVLVFRLLPVARRRGLRPDRAADAAPGADAAPAAGVAADAHGGVAAEFPGAAGHACNVVAHLDDDLLFMNPALQRDIDNGWGLRTVVLTAGDAGLDESYWSEREVGLKAAYAQMCGVADEWTETDAGIPGRGVTLQSLDERPGVQLVFLRLPDGNIDGTGYPATGEVSLQRLWTGTTPFCASVDGAEAYTSDELVETVAALMADPVPSVVRMLDFVGSFGDGDHSDHYASAYFALAASRAAGVSGARVGHRGYPISPRPQNLGLDLRNQKLDTFLTYAAHDSNVPVTLPDFGAYGPWLARSYTCGTGNIAPTAVVTASSANSATGQVADRAVDGWIFGDPDDASHEWATVGGGAGSWLTLEWETPHTVRRVVLYDRPNDDDHVVAGTIQLPDGQAFPTGPLGNHYEPTVVDLPDVTLTSLTFRIDEVSDTTINVGLAEIEVIEANIAPDASVTASSEAAATGQSADRVVDGYGGGFPDAPQEEWATLGGGTGTWLHLSWAAPRLVTRVVLYDRPNPDDRITSAILSFSDGTSIDVPVFDDPGPTSIDVPPRTVTWLTLTVTGVAPTTQNVGLAEIQVLGE